MTEEYPVIKKMYELTLEYTRRVKGFPRDSRFILGDRILSNCYDVLEGLLEAKYTTHFATLSSPYSTVHFFPRISPIESGAGFIWR